MTGRAPLARVPRLLAALRRDAAGVTAIEFAFVAPTFMIMLMGMMDLGHMVYAKAILDGAVEQAARTTTLETGSTTVADAMVTQRVKPIMPNVTISSTRKSYYDFSDIERPEPWNDKNGNGTCDASENYTDENRNGSWNTDRGSSGNGGASDVVLYTVNASYDLLFTGPMLPSGWKRMTLSSVAVRKNQPFANQTSRGATAGVCS